LALIEQAGIEPEVVLYLEATPTASELDEILTKLGLEPSELMRRGEAVYKELGLAARDLPRHEAIELMVKHPVLIERPIVICGNRAVLGRPPENVKELL
jgi:arsenate reductase